MSKRTIIGHGYIEPANAAQSALRMMTFKPVRGKCNGILFMGGRLKEVKGRKVRLVAEEYSGTIRNEARIKVAALLRKRFTVSRLSGRDVELAQEIADAVTGMTKCS